MGMTAPTRPRDTVSGVLRFLRRFRRHAVPSSTAVNDPSISRAALGLRGARAGSQRHRPTRANRDLAERIGTSAYDSERGQT